MRKRFNRVEREALVIGTRVEWRNVSRWGRFGTVVSEINRDDDGFEWVLVRDEKATRTGSGPVYDVIAMRPTMVRLIES